MNNDKKNPRFFDENIVDSTHNECSRKKKTCRDEPINLTFPGGFATLESFVQSKTFQRPLDMEASNMNSARARLMTSVQL